MIFSDIEDSFPTIPDQDKPLLCMYLDKLVKQSRNSFTCAKSTLKKFYEVTSASIRDLSYDDVTAYVAFLDMFYSARSSKRGNLVRVKAYYHFVTKFLGAEGIYRPDVFKFVNIPFLQKNQEKRVGGFKVDVEEIEGKIKIIPLDLMDKILFAAKIRSQMLYVLILILKYCGMRLSEAITIRIDNIDLEKRVIYSGTVRDYAKEGMVIHPFPEHMITEIKKLLATYSADNNWLFPGRTTHIKSPQSTIRNLKVRSGITGWTAHQFRHSLIRRRTDMGCPREINDFLQNHSFRGTQAKYYDFSNCSIADRVALYDKWNPYD